MNTDLKLFSNTFVTENALEKKGLLLHPFIPLTVAGLNIIFSFQSLLQFGIVSLEANVKDVGELNLL